MAEDNKTDYLRLSRDLMGAMIPYYQGASALEAGRFEAQQYYNNAKLQLLAGNRQAAQYRTQGLKTMSDAAVAMVAQGGTVNSDMLARIKKNSDLDAIAAMYDAKANVLTSKYQARAAERQGEREYRAGIIKMGSNLLTAASSYKWGGSQKLPGAAEPAKGIR